MTYNEEQLIKRARTAYFKTGEQSQPGQGGEVREIDGTTYVVLSNTNGTLAVYTWDGENLARNKTWPPELD